MRSAIREGLRTLTDAGHAGRAVRVTRSSLPQLLVAAFVIVASVFAGILSLARPEVAAASAPVGEFSAERAMTHVRAIAQVPHPVGSQANAQVRDYIFERLEDIGLSPELQETTSVVARGSTIVASAVENVVARIPGSDPSGVILLDAHYDSMPMTPGASDCGSCVATLLETARALQAGPTLRNDVVLLFTDNEELGPVAGAAAFVDRHPLAGDIDVVLNFEAIGRTGPSVMFETGPDSGWLVREWAQAVSNPVAQSWFNEVYALTPINTDINEFDEVNGLNFAYLFDGTVYHTLLDNPETIDPASVQHHGSNALEVTRHLGNLDLREARRPGDAIYFSLVPGLLVSYPTSWAVPLVLIAGLVLVGAVVGGYRRRAITARSLLAGFAVSLLSVVGAAVLATGLWFGINQLVGEYQSMLTFGRVYNAFHYYVAFIALALAVTAGVHVTFKRRISMFGQALGALLLFWLLAAAFSVVVPGISYLLAWPLLFSVAAFGWVLWSGWIEAGSWRRETVLLIGVVPGLIIIPPAVRVMAEFGPMIMIGFTVLFVALLFGLLIPQLALITRTRRWWLPAGALLVGLGFVASGMLTAGFDAEQPRPNGMAYLLNSDSGEATWFSAGTQTDAWTAQFYTEDADPHRGSVGELFPMAQSSRFPVRKSAAPAFALDAPEMIVLDDSTVGGLRMLQLRLTSLRQAPMIFFDVEPRDAVKAVVVDGRRLDTQESDRDLWSLVHYTVPPEGVEITLEVEPSQPLRLQVADNSRDLPAAFGDSGPRPDDVMPMPNFDYGTVVVRTYHNP